MADSEPKGYRLKSQIQGLRSPGGRPEETLADVFLISVIPREKNPSCYIASRTAQANSIKRVSCWGCSAPQGTGREDCRAVRSRVVYGGVRWDSGCLLPIFLY
jgi:hypothetical protein